MDAQSAAYDRQTFFCEGMNMKRVLIVFTVCLTVLSAVLATQLIVVGAANDRNKRDLENVYKSSVLSLGDSLDNLEVNMSKLMVARGSGENRELITDTYRHAETAAQSISVLPLSFENITSTTKFFNQVGDWCKSYMRAIDDGADVSEYGKQADVIYKTASALSQKFREIENNIERNGVYASIGQNRIMPYDFENVFADFTHNSVDYPALIYDGPFSDGKSYNFRALENCGEIDEKTALEIASRDFGITDAKAYLTENKTKVFAVAGKYDGEDAMVMLTQKGGFPLLMTRYDSSDSDAGRADMVGVSREEYERKAADYMSSLGFKNLAPVWFNMTGDVAVVNLAPKIDDVIFYTDLVKVKLNGSADKITGFECSGYCAGSCKDDLVPKLTESQAKATASGKIEVKNVRLAVIPVGEKEAFCYEIAGSYEGLDYFVYVDAVSGKEVNVLRVVDNKQGSLTM